MDNLKDRVPTWGFDHDGKETLYYLKPGEELPAGVHKTMPKGTHPHDKELGIPREPEKALDPDGKPANTQGRTPGDDLPKRKIG